MQMFLILNTDQNRKSAEAALDDGWYRMAARTVGIGHQDFGQLIRANCFYVDKTDFIKEWWESEDVVTLITRPCAACGRGRAF